MPRNLDRRLVFAAEATRISFNVTSNAHSGGIPGLRKGTRNEYGQVESSQALLTPSRARVSAYILSGLMQHSARGRILIDLDVTYVVNNLIRGFNVIE